jgi:hypothetical protein
LNNNDKKLRFPKAVTDRCDQKNDRLGVTMVPGALLKVELGLTSLELLVLFALFEHCRNLGDTPFCSYIRIGIMTGIGRKKVGTIAKNLERKGFIIRVRRGRVYSHDLGPLLEKLVTDPLKEFPEFTDDRTWDAKQEIARLKAENEALKKARAVNGGSTDSTNPVDAGMPAASAQQRSITIHDFTITEREIRAKLDYWLHSQEGRDVHPEYLGPHDFTVQDLFKAVEKKDAETPDLSKEALIKAAAYQLFERFWASKREETGDTRAATTLDEKPNGTSNEGIEKVVKELAPDVATQRQTRIHPPANEYPVGGAAASLADVDPDTFIDEFAGPAAPSAVEPVLNQRQAPDVVDDGSIFGAVAEHVGQAPTQD